MERRKEDGDEEDGDQVIRMHEVVSGILRRATQRARQYQRLIEIDFLSRYPHFYKADDKLKTAP